MTYAKALMTLFFLSVFTSQVHAALYWESGVRSKNISFCFVGDALTSRSDRVNEVRDYFRHAENAANITFNYLGTCPEPTKHPSNSKNDYFDGDIRIVLWNVSVSSTGLVPGKGCPMFRDKKGKYDGGNHGGSWSNSPNNLKKHRSCQYNFKLGDDSDDSGTPWLSHTLHELGHGLGLSHEHARADIPGTCVTAGGVTSGYITPYDNQSVMHYSNPGCNIEGNYSQKGLSTYDRLALHIMYPENNRYAEHIGKRVVRAGGYLKLYDELGFRGANESYIYKSTSWKVDGLTVSYKDNLNYRMSFPGVYTVKFAYKDFLNRKYNSTIKVEVLSHTGYRKRNAAISIASVF